MKRKLIQQGLGGYTIYLPKKWVDSNNLKKGAEIDIDVLGNDLVLSAFGISEVKEVDIKLANLTESSIRTTITNAYRKGYDKINVNFDSKKQLNILKKVVSTRLIGFDILKTEETSCIVESVTEPALDQFENIMNKIFFIIQEQFDLTRRKFEENVEFSEFEEIQERIQKFDNFCRRVLSKQKFRNEKTELTWTFLTLLNHGQREIYHMNKISDKIKISGYTKELFEGAEQIFQLLRNAHFKKDVSYLAEIHELEKQLIYKKGYALLEKDSNAVIIYHLLVSIREFYQANSPLFGLLI